MKDFQEDEKKIKSGIEIENNYQHPWWEMEINTFEIAFFFLEKFYNSGQENIFTS